MPYNTNSKGEGMQANLQNGSLVSDISNFCPIFCTITKILCTYNFVIIGTHYPPLRPEHIAQGKHSPNSLPHPPVRIPSS